MSEIPPEAITVRDAIAKLRCVQAGWAFGVPADGQDAWLDDVAETACAVLRAADQDAIGKLKRALTHAHQLVKQRDDQIDGLNREVDQLRSQLAALEVSP